MRALERHELDLGRLVSCGAGRRAASGERRARRRAREVEQEKEEGAVRRTFGQEADVQNTSHKTPRRQPSRGRGGPAWCGTAAQPRPLPPATIRTPAPLSLRACTCTLVGVGLHVVLGRVELVKPGRGGCARSGGVAAGHLNLAGLDTAGGRGRRPGVSCAADCTSGRSGKGGGAWSGPSARAQAHARMVVQQSEAGDNGGAGGRGARRCRAGGERVQRWGGGVCGSPRYWTPSSQT